MVIFAPSAHTRLISRRKWVTSFKCSMMCSAINSSITLSEKGRLPFKSHFTSAPLHLNRSKPIKPSILWSPHPNRSFDTASPRLLGAYVLFLHTQHFSLRVFYAKQIGLVNLSWLRQRLCVLRDPLKIEPRPERSL